MKIKHALAIAASQFIQQFGNKTQTLQLMEQYAVEELELDINQAKKFSIDAVEGQAIEWMNTEEDKHRFFTWYCINYVDLAKRSSSNVQK